MIKTLSLFLWLSLSSMCFAQNLTGKIVSESNGEQIAFASIGVLGTNTAAVTNEAGEFVIKVEKLPAKLRISHVSYLSIEITINDLKELQLQLKPAVVSLNTVTVDPYAGQRIIKKVLENAQANIGYSHYGNAFYRQLTTINGQGTQIYELFYDLQLSPRSVSGWIAKQSRFAQLKQDYMFSMANQSYLTFTFGGYLFSPKVGIFVTLESLKDYRIEIEQFIEQQDQQIAVVSCKYIGKKKKNFYTNSTFYVGIEDHKVYRMENSVFNLPMRFDQAQSKFPIIFTTVATFYPTTGPISTLESLSTKLFLKPSINGTILTTTITSTLSVYQLDEALKSQNFNHLNRDTKDRNVIESITYNPDFWRNNPIVKQTALEDSFIKMMESKSAFGTMTNP